MNCQNYNLFHMLVNIMDYLTNNTVPKKALEKHNIIKK